MVELKKKKLGICLLAAGQGTRLKMKKPKPLVPLLGEGLISFPVMACSHFCEKHFSSLRPQWGVVIGHQGEQVKNYVNEKLKKRFITSLLNYAHQAEQKGTADAVKSYFQLVEASQTDYTLVICADTPLIREPILSQLYSQLEQGGFDAVAATFETTQPFGYGRIYSEKNQKGFQIIEEKEASDEVKKIQQVNSGLYIFKTKYLLEKLSLISNQNSGEEFYLTDTFQLGENVQAIHFENPESFLGVNNLFQLEEANQLIKKEKIFSLMEKGVFLKDAQHIWIDWDVEIEEGAIIGENVVLKSGTKIGREVEIGPHCVIENSVIGEGVKILPFSHLEGATVLKEAQVGPYSRLRPEALIGEKCKIGNFVEIKKSQLDKDVKVSHLSYVGDARIGESTNIGCGFITCNYDGESKHKTQIGKNCFIGSDSQMIAPVEIGDNCFVASGSTINQNMPEGAFAISRGRQVTKENLAKKFIKIKKDK